jgi:hypothetical protein
MSVLKRKKQPETTQEIRQRKKTLRAGPTDDCGRGETHGRGAAGKKCKLRHLSGQEQSQQVKIQIPLSLRRARKRFQNTAKSATV